MDAVTGIVKAILDAKSLTSKRTAATSALASQYLSNPSSQSLLMIGTGTLGPQLIKAHCTARKIKTVYIWGRNKAKAKAIADQLQNENFVIVIIDKIEEAISKADIISSATLSETPLIYGSMLRKGQHIDLVGSYKPTTREADDETMKRAFLFGDLKTNAIKESGDFFIPIQNEVITAEDIIGDLFDLCSKRIQFKRNSLDITVFKSVGHAMEDLIAARYYYNKWKNVNHIS